MFKVGQKVVVNPDYGKHTNHNGRVGLIYKVSYEGYFVFYPDFLRTGDDYSPSDSFKSLCFYFPDWAVISAESV